MYLTIFSSTFISPASILMIADLVCFGLAALIMIFSILFDIKNQRRERAAGKNVLWYKRYPLFGSGGGLCLIIAEMLIILMFNRIVPPTLFFYILASFLILCGFCGSVYSLRLAIEQKKIAHDYLRSLLDKQKDQSLQ